MIEWTIMATAIYHPQALSKLMEYDEALFHDKKIKSVYRALEALYRTNQDVDIAVMASFLKDELSEDDILKLMKHETTVNVSLLLKDLDKERKRVEFQLELEKLLKVAQSGGEIDEIYDKINILYQNFTGTDTEEYCTVDELCRMGLDELFKTGNYIPTGIKVLDEKIHGMFNGQLIVIGGRQKKGKTTLALNILANQSEPFLLFSLEMKRLEIYSKMLAAIAEVPAWKIETKKMSDAERYRVVQAIEFLKGKTNITIYDNDLSINKILSISKRLCKKKGIKGILIDYLQLITGGRGENQNLRVASITRDLKNLAHGLNIPVIIISQLSRESEKQNRRPVSSDLRDSGSIEQDADIILMVHEHDGRTELIVADGRKSGKGIIDGLKFEGEFSRFVPNMAYYSGIFKEEE